MNGWSHQDLLFAPADWVPVIIEMIEAEYRTNHPDADGEGEDDEDEA